MTNTAAALISRVASLTPLGRIYPAAAADQRRPFSSRVLSALDVTADAPDAAIAHIPRTGPLVVVANHPFGALDGLLLLDVLARARDDVKLLGNQWLDTLPELANHLLPVDVFGGRAAVRRNARALRGALRWLRQGGCVGIFPAGEVAHAVASDGRVVDSPWNAAAAALAVRAGAAVLPVFFEGSNSRLFLAAGRLHPLLRTALLPSELLAKRGSRVSIRIGAPMPADTVAAAGAARERTACLRRSVERLAAPRPIAPRGDLAAVVADIAALGTPLLESGSYQVFCARAPALPAVLPELGRLREIAFRAVGEGTGRPRDLDVFDDVYHHLFVWDRDAQEIAGAYRLGATDDILPTAGVGGLYTRTLFDYGDALMHQIGPALELGRSFVATDYQRDFSPLLLLWKGISRFVVRNPRYRALFGVVSIVGSPGTELEFAL